MHDERNTDVLRISKQFTAFKIAKTKNIYSESQWIYNISIVKSTFIHKYINTYLTSVKYVNKYTNKSVKQDVQMLLLNR